MAGIEPARGCPHGILSPGRLPVPPHQRAPLIIQLNLSVCQELVFDDIIKNMKRNIVCVIFTTLLVIMLVGCFPSGGTADLLRGGNTDFLRDGIADLPQDTPPLSPGYSQTDRHEWFVASAQAFALANTGDAVIIDVRDEAEYTARRVSGAVNAPYDEIVEYATANIPDKDTLIFTYCFCGGMGGPALSARNLLAEAGYTNVFYTDPEGEWEYEGTNISDVSNNIGHRIITGAEAKALVEADDGAILLDVRNQDEYDDGHIENSTLIPVSELESRLSELPDKDTVIIVYCRAGVRSAAAYEILVSNGYTNVYDMQKFDNWR